jgi:hypothetical protein
MPTVLGLGAIVTAGLSMLAARRSERNSRRSADAAEESRDVAVRANRRAETPTITASAVLRSGELPTVLLTSDRDLDSMQVSLALCEVDGKDQMQFPTAFPGGRPNVAAGVQVHRLPNSVVQFDRVPMGKPLEMVFYQWRGDPPRQSWKVRFTILCAVGTEQPWKVAAEATDPPQVG